MPPTNLWQRHQYPSGYARPLAARHDCSPSWPTYHQSARGCDSRNRSHAPLGPSAPRERPQPRLWRLAGSPHRELAVVEPAVAARHRCHSAAARTSAISSFRSCSSSSRRLRRAPLLVIDHLGAQRGRCGALRLAQCVLLLLLVRGQRGQRVQPPRRAGSAAGSAPVARSAPPMRARWAKAAVVRQRGIVVGAAVVAVGGVVSPTAAGVAAVATATRAAIRRPACPSRCIVASTAAGDAALARGPRPCRSPISRLSVALRPPATRGVPAASCASARARPRASSLARPSCGRSGDGARPGAARP